MKMWEVSSLDKKAIPLKVFCKQWKEHSGF